MPLACQGVPAAYLPNLHRNSNWPHDTHFYLTKYNLTMHKKMWQVEYIEWHGTNTNFDVGSVNMRSVLFGILIRKELRASCQGVEVRHESNSPERRQTPVYRFQISVCHSTQFVFLCIRSKLLLIVINFRQV